jgi:hypothetical protein
VCCKWHTGQCPMHQAELHSNSSLSGISKGRSAIIHRTRPVSGVHQTCPVSQRRYKSYHPHSRLRINQASTTKITPSTKTGRLR